jgi:tetratricopeptide (TPR) repeat protein
MGNYYLKKHMPDSAFKQIHKLEEENTRLKKPNYILVSLLQNGIAYSQLGENDLAEVYYKKGLVISDSIATPVVTLLFNYEYIPYLLSTNQVEKARQQAFQLLNTGKQIENNLYKLNAAGYLSQAYEKLNQTDSAFFYLRLQSALKDSVFNQNSFNKIQALAFNEGIRKIDEEAKQTAAEEQRKQNIQYALIALGIIILLTLYLSLSRSFITNTKLIKFFGVVALLIVFEFLNLLLHPFLERITNHSPVLMLLALVCIAALLVPLHHRVEKWATTKLVEKNKQIRLAAAKRTIEQLEKKDS